MDQKLYCKAIKYAQISKEDAEKLDKITAQSLSVKNFYKIGNLTPQNFLFLLNRHFGPSNWSRLTSDQQSFMYLIKTESAGVYLSFYDYKMKPSIGIVFNKDKESDPSLSKIKEQVARQAMQIIDELIDKPPFIGDYRWDPKSGRFTYVGKEIFRE